MADRVLVFAGAGASKAVRSDQFPTTKEFFDRLPEQIVDDRLFQFSLGYLKDVKKIETVDIEHVLWALQSLSTFFDSVSNSKQISGYAFKTNIFQQIQRNSSFGNFSDVSAQMQHSLTTLISEINKIVYDLYSYEPTPNEIENNWVDLISKLESSDRRLDLFTTNYDVVIESALNIINGEVSARVIRGINGTARQTIDLGRWIDSSSGPGLLTKLHGSLDWKLQKDKIFVGDPVFTGDHSKQAIIYPGFKGDSETAFFQVFHEYLAQSMSESQLVIFIGFAFRDEHINRLIRENIRSQSKVFIVNPDRDVRFPSNRVEPIYLTSGFDFGAINEIIKEA